MTIDKAKEILVEMQKWRRAEPPYDRVGTKSSYPPYSPTEYGEALDVAITILDELG